MANNQVIEIDFNWKEPIPLSKQGGFSRKYPVDALPNEVRNAVTAYHKYGQQPVALLASSALANISLACQGIANIARDKILISPTSLYFMTVAKSGERKTAADNAFGQAIREWEKQQIEDIRPDYRIKVVEHKAWQMEKKGLLNLIKRFAFLGEGHTFDQQLKDLEMNEPEIPLLPKLHYADVTAEGLAHALGTEWPSAALWSDEAAVVLGSQGMQASTTRFVALLNALWDGKAFTAHRKSVNNTIVTDRRLTLSLMMQPILLDKLLLHQNGINRQSGFLARVLMSYPQSTMGTRFYKPPEQFDLSYFKLYNQRIKECLDQTLPVTHQGFNELPSITFSPQGKRTWVKLFNKIETELLNPIYWKDMEDLASKAAENVARLSALLHLYQGKSGDITSESIEAAYEIIEWHLFEAKNIFNQQDLTQAELDAKKLLEWMTNNAIKETNIGDLRRTSPIRDTKRRDDAVALLRSHHYLHTSSHNKKTVAVYLNPSLHNTQ